MYDKAWRVLPKSMRRKEETMILIIGGAWQGKLVFAMELAMSAGKMKKDDGKTHVTPLFENSATHFTGHQLDMQADPLASSVCKSGQSTGYQFAEGSKDSFEAAMTCPIIHGLHEYIRRLLKEGKSVDAFLEAVWRQNPDVIITSDELGCGIVPFDPADREWREVSGRASVRLARISREVYRMVCGIATQIK